MSAILRITRQSSRYEDSDTGGSTAMGANDESRKPRQGAFPRDQTRCSGNWTKGMTTYHASLAVPCDGTEWKEAGLQVETGQNFILLVHVVASRRDWGEM